MSERRKITCDGCGLDLTWTGNSVDWRISLQDEQIPHRAGAVTDVLICPKLGGVHWHFCTKQCLLEKIGADND